MKRKQVFLTLALAPGLLVGAGAKIIGSKSVDQSGFAANAETLGLNSPTEKKSAMKKTTEEKKLALRKTDTTSTEKKSATRSKHRRKHRSSTRKTDTTKS